MLFCPQNTRMKTSNCRNTHADLDTQAGCCCLGGEDLTLDFLLQILLLLMLTQPRAEGNSEKTATNLTQRHMKLHEESLWIRGKKILTPASAQEFSVSPAGLSWLNCARLLYCGHDMNSRCLPAASSHYPPSRPHCTDKETNPATTVQRDRLVSSPPQEKGRGDYNPCFGLSMFHLEAVKWDPHMAEKGMEAGQYPFSPPLIHAPCSLIPLTPVLSPPAGSVLHGRNSSNTLKCCYVQSPWQPLTWGA